MVAFFGGTCSVATSATTSEILSHPSPSSSGRSVDTNTNTTADRELREARDTIKRLTAACEGYKSEIERLNLLRQRRGGGGSVVSEDEGKGLGGDKGGQGGAGGLSVSVVALIVLLAFLLGVFAF